MDLTTLIVAIVASVAAVASAIIALIARADAKKSGEEASRAAERATTATEKMATIQGKIFDGPPWTIEWFGGHAFLITNTSPVAAVNVELDTDPAELDVQIDREGPYTIGARSGIKVQYMALLSDAFTRDIVVRWQREGEHEQREWRHPIPAVPR